MVKIVKYCKKEHNVATGCNTLQLGTFQYYRELDPSFSIGDVEEGYIYYRGPENPITISADQYHSVTGGMMRITDRTTIGRPVIQNPGGTFIRETENEWVLGADSVMRIHLKGTLEVKLYYPNAYIFSTAVLDDGEKPDPSSVSDEYDSYYEIKSESIQGFVNTITNSLGQQLSLRDLKIAGTEMEKGPITDLLQPLGIKIKWRHGPVQYVPETQIRLNSPEDFDNNRFYEIYEESMFKKNSSKAKNKEYRFIFFVQHATYGSLSVQKEPKRLVDMNPILQHLNP